MINVLVVISTFNNRATLRKVAEKALSTGVKVLVVNDGSTDGGPATIDGLPISRLDFSENRGKGAAILSAAEWAGTNGFTHIITLDADGQHDPGDVPRFLELIRKDPWTVIIGIRRFRETVPLSSRFGRKWSNLWLWITTGIRVQDSQSGFRAYPVAALRQVACRGRRYDFEVEILVRSIWAGLTIVHTDVTVHYSDETRKASHFDPLRDNARISQTFARLVIRNFFPWPHKVLFNGNERGKLSVLHPLRSFELLFKERITPKEIVFASMLGIFLGTLPLIACHSVAILFVATRLRLNRLVALSVSNICMPPFVPAVAVAVGYFIRNGRYLSEFSMQTLWHEAPQRFIDYLIGSLIVGPVFAILVGSFIYFVIIFCKGLTTSGGKHENEPS